jgi:hypothetical protein
MICDQLPLRSRYSGLRVTPVPIENLPHVLIFFAHYVCTFVGVVSHARLARWAASAHARQMAARAPFVPVRY